MKIKLDIELDSSEHRHYRIEIDGNKITAYSFRVTGDNPSTFKPVSGDEQTLLTSGEAVSYVQRHIQRVLNEAFEPAPITL